MYIIVEGTIGEGFSFTGPFEYAEDATEYAERECDAEWWVSNLYSPAID